MYFIKILGGSRNYVTMFPSLRKALAPSQKRHRPDTSRGYELDAIFFHQNGIKPSGFINLYQVYKSQT